MFNDEGYSSDKKSFPQTIERVSKFYKGIESAPEMCFVADSALYGDKLNELNIEWLTRVPETYGEAKLLCAREEVAWAQSSDERYQFFEYFPNDRPEKWLLVRSEAAFLREKATFFRRHEKMFDDLQKLLWHCCCQTFNCEGDAKKAMDKIIRSKKHFYQIEYEVLRLGHYSKKGHPSKDEEPDKFSYQINVTNFSSDLSKIKKEQKILGRFILATNVLSHEKMSHENMLSEYKEQSGVEQGFRFIKNDTFGLDEVYLKKPERVGALMAIMTLCLLVYGLTQHRLRESLQKNNEVLPDQKKKPTQRPTLMWIFLLFSSVTMIKTEESNQSKRLVLNVHPLHQKIILLFGERARKIYLLPESLDLKEVKLNQKTWLKWCGM